MHVDFAELHAHHKPGRRPLLLIHGFGSTARLTWDTTGWFRAVDTEERGYIAPDLLGHGDSPRPLNVDQYRLEALAESVVKTLDSVEISTVDVIGYSMGAQVARVLAAEHPGRVRKIVLGGIGELNPLTAWDRDAVEAFLRGDTDDAGSATKLLQLLLEHPRATPESIAALIEGVSLDVPERTLEQASLLVVGERDEIAIGADRLAARLGAQLHIVPRRTHWNAVSARSFKQIALDFLRE